MIRVLLIAVILMQPMVTHAEIVRDTKYPTLLSLPSGFKNVLKDIQYFFTPRGTLEFPYDASFSKYAALEREGITEEVINQWVIESFRKNFREIPPNRILTPEGVQIESAKSKKLRNVGHLLCNAQAVRKVTQSAFHVKCSLGTLEIWPKRPDAEVLTLGIAGTHELKDAIKDSIDDSVKHLHGLYAESIK